MTTKTEHRAGRDITFASIGVFGGVLLAAAIGVIVVNIILPWEDICAVLGPAQELTRAGSELIDDLRAWLAQAERFLAADAPSDAGARPDGLGGLLDRARDVTETVIAPALTAPLRALIDVVDGVLLAVQAAVDAARDVASAIDSSRCG